MQHYKCHNVHLYRAVCQFNHSLLRYLDLEFEARRQRLRQIWLRNRDWSISAAKPSHLRFRCPWFAALIFANVTCAGVGSCATYPFTADWNSPSTSIERSISSLSSAWFHAAGRNWALILAKVSFCATYRYPFTADWNSASTSIERTIFSLSSAWFHAADPRTSHL